MGDFVPKGLADWSDNLSPDSEDGKESWGATEGAAKERLRQGRPQPQIEVILEPISFKTLFQIG